MQTIYALNLRAANAVRLLLALIALCHFWEAMAYAQTAAPPSSASAPLPSLTPATPYWRAVALASHIFYGRIHSITDKPSDAIPIEGDFTYREFMIKTTLDGTLKGKSVNTALLPFAPYTGYWHIVRDNSRNRDYVASLPRNKPVIFFGDQGEQAPVAASPLLITSVQAEVANQTLLLAQFARLPAARPDQFDKRIAGLIKIIQDDTGYFAGGEIAKLHDPVRTLVRQRALKAVNDIIAFGPAATPALIRQMDDSRKLMADFADEVSLKYFAPRYPDGSPADVGNLISAILVRISQSKSDKGFFAFGGNTEADKRRVVDQWRVWACYTMAEAEAKANKKPANGKKPLQ